MTDRSHPAGLQGPHTRPDFDLVEDLGAAGTDDQEAFDRALSALLPQEGSAAADGAAVDIDLDDFEAFNRELDARLAEARVRPEVEPVEDLGAEIIHPATPLPTPTPPEAPAAVEVPDDVVTLGTAGVAAAAAQIASAPAERSAVAEAAAPAPGPTSSAATPAPAAGPKGTTLAVALGAAGLLAGIAGFWTSQSREADLARLEKAVAKTTPAALAPNVPNFGPELVRLDGRLADLGQRIDRLGTAVSDGATSTGRTLGALEERLARAEAQLAAVKATQAAAAATAAKEPPPPAAQSTAAPREPVKEPVKAAAEPPPQPALKSAVKAAGTSAPAPKTGTRPVEPATPDATGPTSASDADPSPAAVAPAAKSKKPLPKAGDGTWVVVVGSFPSEAEAYRRLNRIENMGLVADVVPAALNGQTWHRLVVPGYASQDDAKAVAADLRARGHGQPWVLQRKGE